MELIKTTESKAIFVRDNTIIALEIPEEARQVLNYYKKIPINDN